MSVNPPTGNPWVDVGVAVLANAGRLFGGSRDTDLNKRQRARFEEAGGNVIGHREGAPRGSPRYEWQGERVSKKEAKALLRAIDRGWIGGPSVADQLPPTPQAHTVSPWWAAAGAIAFPTQRERKRRKRAKTRARYRSQLDRVLAEARKRGGEYAKKHPRLGRVLTRYGRAGRAGGAAVAVTAAWDLGQWIGSKAYSAWSDWYYASSSGRAGRAPPKPRSIARPLRIRVGRVSLPRPGVIAPSAPAQRPTRTQSRPARAPSVMRSTFPALPGERALMKNRVAMGPKPAPKLGSPRLPRPAPRSSSPGTPKFKLPDWVRPVLTGALLAGLAAPKPKPKSFAPSPWQPPQTQGLTYTQYDPLSLASPQAAKARCRCPTKKRKTGKKSCRNPIVRRSRRTSGGKRFSIITRELKCPA